MGSYKTAAVSESAKEGKKLKSDAQGLELEDLSFILTAIRNSMIAGAELEQAVKTVYKLQTLYARFDKLATSSDNDNDK